MQFKSLRMINFRQYIDDTIFFSVNKEKNITLITGTLGSGKTTLQQAFRYVLYGITEFNNTEILNNKIKSRMSVNESASTEVTLEFNFNDADYVLTRKQKFTKYASEAVMSSGAKVELIEIVNGNFKPLSDEIALRITTSMIPKQLSDYFFVSGETVGNMAKNIQDSSKQDDFVKVVKSILGLNYLTNAIDHLKIAEKQYDREIDRFGGEKILEISQLIDENLDKISENNRVSSELETKREVIIKRQGKLDTIIKSIPNAEKLQTEFTSTKQEIENTKHAIEDLKNNYLSQNNMNFIYLIASPLIRNGLNILKSKTEVDFGIPNLHSSSIDHILSSGRCICGHDLILDDEARRKLEYLKTTLPPHSIGTAVRDYRKDAKFRIESQSIVVQQIKQTYKNIKQKMKDIEELEHRLSILSEQMLQITSVVASKQEYDQYEVELKKLDRQQIELHKELGILELTVEQLKKEKEALSVKTKASLKFEEYRVYAETLLLKLRNHYSGKEENIRLKLEENINYYIKTMYREGFSVEIDSKYRIKVHVEESHLKDNLDKSNGQGYLIVFSFISSVLKMAKEKSQDEEVEVTPEYYPIVMDAPLSAIDIDYIGQICNTLPTIAEQVILFLNNKDSEILKEYAMDFVGRNYVLESSGLLETKIREVQHV